MSTGYVIETKDSAPLAPPPAYSNQGYAPPPQPPHPVLLGQQTHNTTVVINQPMGSTANPHVLVTKSQLSRRDWTTGLCGCFNDMYSCLMGLFCLPVLLCMLANRLEECVCMPFCVPGGFMAMRTKVRVMGGVEGSVCCDAMATAYCPTCAACQLYREMRVMDL